MVTYPNQKIVTIVKDRYEKNFTQIGNDELFAACRTLSGATFKLYMYFAKNADGWKFALSSADAMEVLGIGKTTYYRSIKELEEAGYLKLQSGNKYTFFVAGDNNQLKFQNGTNARDINHSEFQNGTFKVENPNIASEKNADFPKMDIQIDKKNSALPAELPASTFDFNFYSLLKDKAASPPKAAALRQPMTKTVVIEVPKRQKREKPLQKCGEHEFRL